MKTTHASIAQILNKHINSPLPIEVIPNHMGINLCSVEGMTWTRQPDGQLVSLTIHFKPAPLAVNGKPVDPATADTFIEKLGLSTRSQNALVADGILRIGDLLKMSAFELSRIPNIGKLSHTEILDKLASMGLSLKS